MYRTMSIVLAVSLLATGCGEDSDSGPTTEATTASATQPTTAETSPPTTASRPITDADSPVGLLLIGDSFTVGLGAPIAELAAAGHPSLTFEVAEITQPGMLLEGHWNISRPIERIQSGDWRVVVLQEDLSIDGSDAPTFFDHVRLFNDEVTAAGGETVLYMPWEYDNDNPMRIAEIADTYETIGAELGVKVAPVGLAWSRSLAERPDLDLYGGDRSHASLPGAVLTIFVLHATIFDSSPEGLSFPLLAELIEEGVLTQQDVVFLQGVAWDTVTEFRSTGQ